MCVCVCVCVCVLIFVSGVLSIGRHFVIFFSVFNLKNAMGTVPINEKCVFVSKNGRCMNL